VFRLDRNSLTVVAVLFFLGGGVLAYLIVLSPYLHPELPRVAVPSGWTEIQLRGLGVALQVPAEYQVDENREGTGFRAFYQGSTKVDLMLIEHQAAAERGLWARHEPIRQVELGGRPASYYLYTHFDAFSGIRTHAYALPFQGRWLALELRTRRVSPLEDLGIVRAEDPPLGETENRILNSFHFLEPPS